jgi:AraC-like DNA-binding protein
VPPHVLANLGDSAQLFGEPRTHDRPDILPRANRVAASLRSERSLDQSLLDIYELIEGLAGGAAPALRLPQPWLARIREMLESNIAGPIVLNNMAAEAGVSPVALSKAFRQAYGCSATEFIRRQRIARARASLLASHRPLVVIAAELGFADQAHFTRAFKAETGLTPGEFRRLAPKA